ncbi:hypothetical protein PHYPSEUDO_006173 [Phytophthora pseudosyringae]|uniref:RxLR effector protein n=1 Tax=Phytophthora pseudosyringae TaxID=221518 RepID=A0A8T1WEM2_9STRA|nr:hypothetical protein PHYPSEUDO_006173 [Phytophthora pseudosyringae]
MRTGNAFAVAAVFLLGSSVSMKVHTDEASSVSSVQAVDAALTEGRVLKSHEGNEGAVNEERARSSVASKIDALVDPARLDAAMSDLATMRALFKL